jgi:hypothetical protein
MYHHRGMPLSVDFLGIGTGAPTTQGVVIIIEILDVPMIMTGRTTETTIDPIEGIQNGKIREERMKSINTER